MKAIWNNNFMIMNLKLIYRVTEDQQKGEEKKLNYKKKKKKKKRPHTNLIN